MIKPTRAWLDSAGQLHTTREDACKAEFARELWRAIYPEMAEREPDLGRQVPLGRLVDLLPDLGKLLDAATREDRRADMILTEGDPNGEARA